MKRSETYFEINELVSRLLELQEKAVWNFANVMTTILNTPTIEIVRCKDCCHYENCKELYEDGNIIFEDNGYCHYGELKV